MDKIAIPFRTFVNLPWINQASHWQLPPAEPTTSGQDAFMLGGNGCLSARMGMQPAYSTIDRLMGPEFDSYGYYQNNYFRRSAAGVAVRWPHMLKSWISVDWPYPYNRPQQRLWRIPGTAIVCTWEQLQARDLDGIWISGIELMTVNFIHPEQPILFRHIALRNGSAQAMRGIRITLDAPPDVIWPDVGHNSQIRPHGSRLIEQVTEYEQTNRFAGDNPNKERVQRVRVCLRGMLGGSRRGVECLAGPAVDLEPGGETACLAYLIASPDGSIHGAEVLEAVVLSEIHREGHASELRNTWEAWQRWRSEGLAVSGPDDRIPDFIDAALVAQKQAQHNSGGIMVGDDYTASFVRDCNGSHLLLGAGGYPRELQKSLDFFYRQDQAGNFQNSYLLDLGETSPPAGQKPWFETALANLAEAGSEPLPQAQAEKAVREVMTPGDVPNYRVLWYWWQHLRSGDLEGVRQRWSYLSALIHLQRFDAFEYLNGYSRDETYGIGPVGELRHGVSADNSFIALAAVQAMAEMARRLAKPDEAAAYTRLAERIRQAIDQFFWLEADGAYAMRRTPDWELDARLCSPGILRPLWLGCKDLDPARLASSVDAVLRHLWTAPGFLRIIPADFWMTCGDMPGYLLASLCRLEHPLAEQAFHDLLGYINPGGTCAEYYEYAAPLPRADIHRSRNWETGINAEAVLGYLAGFEPDAWAGQFGLRPHLPSGWDACTLSGMAIGRSQVDLSLRRMRDGLAYHVNLRGEGHYRAALRCVIPAGMRLSRATLGGRAVDVMPQINRYGVQAIPLELDLSGGKGVEVCLHWGGG